MPTGLTQDGIDILNAAIAGKVTFDAINVMAMDYGSASIEMGTAATQAAASLYSQLDTAFKSAGQTKTDAQLWPFHIEARAVLTTLPGTTKPPRFASRDLNVPLFCPIFITSRQIAWITLVLAMRL
jgi:hypothetical protein